MDSATINVIVESVADRCMHDPTVVADAHYEKQLPKNSSAAITAG